MTPLLAAAATDAASLDMFALCLVLVAAWGGGQLATKAGYPAVLGELLAGIVLGPPVLGLLADGAGLVAIGELGIVLMMVYIGTEIDLDDLRRASRAGLLAAIGGFVVPFVGGVFVTLAFGFDLTAGLFVGAAVGVTSLATKSRILADLRLFDTRIAYVLVAGALLSDTATLLLFAGITSVAAEGGGVGSTVAVGARAVAAFAIFGGAAVVAPRVGTMLRERFALDGSRFGLGVLIAGGLLGAALAEVMGLHAILGAFLAGMVLRRGVLSPRSQRGATELLERLSIGVLAPVFFTTAGFAISLSAARENLGLLLAVIAVATFGKVLGTAVFYLPTGHGWREGLVVGGAMNGRGAVEIVVAGIGLEQGLIGPEIFTVLVLMAIVTTASVPVMLKLGVEWLRGRGELADASGSRSGVLIVGAGPLAIAWADALQDHRDVWLLDSNAERCGRARDAGLQVVLGDAMDADDLRRAHAEDAGLLLVLTPNAEVNLVVGEVAREEFTIRDVRVAMGLAPTQATRMLLAKAGARPLGVVPVDVESWGGRLQRGEAGPSTLSITDRSPEDVKTRLDAGVEALPLVVLRGDDAIPYPLVDRLRPGDEVVALAATDVAHALGVVLAPDTTPGGRSEPQPSVVDVPRA